MSDRIQISGDCYVNESIRDKQNRLTENIICNSFLELLKTKEFEKITVADVCREANINRGTFYLHYRDIIALVDFINSWYIDAIAPFCFQNIGQKPDAASLEECYRGIVEVLLSWPEYSCVILGHERGQSVIDRVVELATETFSAVHRQHFPEADYSRALYLFTAELYGTWAILRKWCREGLKDPPDRIIAYLKTFNLTDRNAMSPGED